MIDVAIAGAGPVGLFAAALLDTAGVHVEIFEKADGPSVHSKATTMHPRSLEMLGMIESGDGRRLVDQLVEQGRQVPDAQFALLPQRLSYARLDSPYRYLLTVPQATTERALTDLLRDRGVPVHYGQAVSTVSQDAGQVRFTAGDVVREARFLIGADGARSEVRRQAGIGFPGSPPTTIGFVADLDLADPPGRRVALWDHERGTIGVTPLPDGRWRIFGALAADAGLSPDRARARQAEPLDLEEVRTILTTFFGHDLGLGSGVWFSRSTDATRVAERFRHGRVLLAGDAAHVHLPAGGQGLNVGLQDAANLAWKLTAHLRGRARPDLLDSYHHERHEVARILSENTLAQGALLNTFTRSNAALRDLFGGLVETGGEVAEELAGWLSGLSVRYPAPQDAHPMVGTRAPDVELDGIGLLRALRPDRFLLLDMVGGLGDAASAQVQVRPVPSPPQAWAGIDAVLVRPDGYVAAAGSAVDVRAALRLWLPVAGAGLAA